ncbi:Uma2 family endonuclease [Kitasatospora sp. NPDC096147]|uniref:Uma2 family endonuclease n=1 Tax=Kitasatospora sp. NPDC096147 TaxID=3364093 RepID=UPI0038207919
MIDEWMESPSRGWTYHQVAEVDVPFDWDLVDGVVTPRARTDFWHDVVRDALAEALHRVRPTPFTVTHPTTVLLDPHNVVRPDAVVFDPAGLDVFALEGLPPTAIVLLVEVVTPSSRANDRFRKPGQYAEAGIPFYWRVERGEDDLPVVHEFHRDEAQGVYLPVAVHEGLLRAELPFAVEIDLKQVVEL